MGDWLIFCIVLHIQSLPAYPRSDPLVCVFARRLNLLYMHLFIDMPLSRHGIVKQSKTTEDEEARV